MENSSNPLQWVLWGIVYPLVMFGIYSSGGSTLVVTSNVICVTLGVAAWSKIFSEA